MKTKFTKRILNIVLALVVLVSYMPTTSFATDFLTDEESVKEPVVIAQAAAKENKQVKLSWLKTTGATKYKIVGNDAKKSKDKTIKSSTKRNSFVVKKISGKKLSSHKLYRFCVKAYNGSTLLASSQYMYVITANTYKANGKTYGNVSKFKMAGNKKAVVLDTRTVDPVIGHPVIKIYKDKRHIKSDYASKFRYTVESPSVIDVDSNGRITAKKLGVSNVYVQAVNGKYQTVKVTVANEVHIIKFNKNAEDATGIMQEQKVPVLNNETVRINSCKFNRKDYVFAGWAVASTGSVKYSDCAEIKLDKDIELFAVWKENEEPTSGGGGGPADTRTDLEKAQDQQKETLAENIEEYKSFVPAGFEYELSGAASADVAKMVASAESAIDKATTPSSAEAARKEWDAQIQEVIEKDILDKYKPEAVKHVTAEASKFVYGDSESIDIPEEFWSEEVRNLVASAESKIYEVSSSAADLTNSKGNGIEDVYKELIKAQHEKESYVLFKNSCSDESYYQVIKNNQDTVLTSEPIKEGRFYRPDFNIASSNAHPIGGKMFSFIGCTDNAARYVFYDASDNAIFEASGNTLAKISSDGTGNTEYIPITTSAEGFYNEISAASKYSVSGKETYFDGWNYDIAGADKWLASCDSVSAESSSLITLYAMWETDDQFYVVGTKDDNEILASKIIGWSWENPGLLGKTIDGIGNGRRNTVMALSDKNSGKCYPALGKEQQDNYLWSWIRGVRKNYTNDSDDWYIGTPAEQQLLIESGLTYSPDSTKSLLVKNAAHCWTSVQDSNDLAKAYVIGSDDQGAVSNSYKVNYSSSSFKAVAIRSF